MHPTVLDIIHQKRESLCHDTGRIANIIVLSASSYRDFKEAVYPYLMNTRYDSSYHGHPETYYGMAVSVILSMQEPFVHVTYSEDLKLP
jgi:hypothetical protein